MLLELMGLMTVDSVDLCLEERTVRVTGLSGEKIDFLSDSLEVVNDVDED